MAKTDGNSNKINWKTIDWVFHYQNRIILKEKLKQKRKYETRLTTLEKAVLAVESTAAVLSGKVWGQNLG